MIKRRLVVKSTCVHPCSDEEALNTQALIVREVSDTRVIVGFIVQDVIFHNHAKPPVLIAYSKIIIFIRVNSFHLQLLSV